MFSWKELYCQINEAPSCSCDKYNVKFYYTTDLSRYDCYILMKVLQNEDGKMWKERFGMPNEVEVCLNSLKEI